MSHKKVQIGTVWTFL